MPLTTVKSAVVTPMPSASVQTAIDHSPPPVLPT
jgi:hypothetical protein